LFADYSQPNQDGFAHWLAERGMDKSLAVPNPDVRKHPGSDLYLPGHDGQWAAAYNQYYSDLTADTIGYFARIVKEETEGRCLAGTFYGYVIQLAGEPRQTLAAHASLRKVLDDPNVDFLGGIPLHNYRRLDGYSAFVSATESILAAGKLYVNENDLFSWLHPWHWNTEYNPKDPRRGVVFMHRREIANQAVHGAVGQWFSLQTSWHHDKALQADFARQIRLQAQSLRYDRSSVAEIAFMVDDTTFSWTPPESVLPGLCNVQLLYSLAKTGTPVDVWLLSDLDRLPERIRFIVIANAAAAYPRDIAKLEALVRQGGKTIVAVGAPGLVDPTNGAWRSERPAEVLGLPIRVDDAALPGNIALNESGAPVASFGASPRPRARVEGEGFLKYPDGACAGTERPLHTGGRLIWCGMPPLSVSLLRGWLERAGVHCYAPPECFVYAARELVSITSPIEGDVNIEWPRDVHVEDLFDGWRGSGRSIRCPFELGQTRLFHVKPRMP
ncbi:MAG: hypothetical protein NTU83_04780, partial [Candidatus Hydrogenedentes bacterium]|nr:hypothetical protein [Candidatus Hydrogenedentota bacterium]